MSIVSSMIKSAKMIEKRQTGVSAVRISYLSLKGEFCFILEFLLDFRKNNPVILVIRYIFPY